MASSKEIKRRIRSVRNIGQITKAMELVSAAKMRKAQAQALSSRSYAKLSSSLLESIIPKAKSNHELLVKSYEGNGSDKVLVILVSPDGGLAGALNTNLIAKTAEIIKQEGRDQLEFITVGKKGTDIVRRMGFKLVATFDSKNKHITVFDAKPIAQIAIDDFMSGNYGKVFIIYTDFISTLVQRPRITQMLPFAKVSEKNAEDFLFEPDADEVLEDLIYRTLEFAVYQALVEAQASEHSARMVAMRNANQASKELIDELQLSYNQARQAGITRELSEISAAKLAMEG